VTRSPLHIADRQALVPYRAWQAACPDLPDLPSDQNTRIQFHAQDGVDVESDPDAPGDGDDVGYEESSLASQPCEPAGSDGSVTPRASPCAVDLGRDTSMAGYTVQGDGDDSDLDVFAAMRSDTQAAPASALIHHESEAGGSTSLHQMTSITTDPAQPPTVPQTHLKLPPLPPKQYRCEHLSQTESKSIAASPESLPSHRSGSSHQECSLTISVPGKSVTAVHRLPREWLQAVRDNWTKIRLSPANSGVLFRLTYPDDGSITGSVSEEVNSRPRSTSMTPWLCCRLTSRDISFVLCAREQDLGGSDPIPRAPI
jgi:hypothetical protein